MFKKIIKTAFPAIIGSFFSQSHCTINLIFIGALGQKILIAALGLGNIFQNMIAEATFWGLNGAFDTLASQALGTKNTA